jgi:TRAP-type C4-dicarboxylate transport system substrate-binding protein
VLSRADLSRTGVLVVALCSTVAATGACARELRAADTQNEDYPTVQALRFMGHLISERSNDRHEIKVFHSRHLSEKETLDGAENNWPPFVTAGHYRHAGHYTLTEHTMGPEVLVMSQAWVTLSAKDRIIFRGPALRSSQLMREMWRDLEDQSRKQAESPA